jgi:hypothetical protein
MFGTKLNRINFLSLYFIYKYGSILWDIAPCSPLKANRLFGVASFFRVEE